MNAEGCKFKVRDKWWRFNDLFPQPSGVSQMCYQGGPVRVWDMDDSLASDGQLCTVCCHSRQVSWYPSLQSKLIYGITQLIKYLNKSYGLMTPHTIIFFTMELLNHQESDKGHLKVNLQHTRWHNFDNTVNIHTHSIIHKRR